MTKNEYWNALCNKNHAFKNKEVKIKTEILKKIVEQSWEKGYNQHKSISESFNNSSKSYDSDIFSKLFK